MMDSWDYDSRYRRLKEELISQKEKPTGGGDIPPILNDRYAALQNKLNQLQLENTLLRDENLELGLLVASYKLELEKLRAEWNPPRS